MPDNGTIELAGALNGTLDLEGELGGTIQVPRDGVDGVSPVVTVTDITGGHRVTITDAEGTSTFDVIDGVDGEDGVSPTIEVSAVTGGHEIYITDASGVHLFTVMDGTNGTSATIQVTDITDGHRLTIRDASGTHTVDVMDGEDGQDGGTPTVVKENVYQSWSGPAGSSLSSERTGFYLTITDAEGNETTTGNIMEAWPVLIKASKSGSVTTVKFYTDSSTEDATLTINDGQDGAQGPAGQGVPTGGTTGQVLKKKSGTNYDTEWADESGGGGDGKMPVVTYGTKSTVVDTTTVAFTEDEDNEWYVSEDDPLSGFTGASFEPDTLYIVTWDGDPYECFFVSQQAHPADAVSYYSWKAIGDSVPLGCATGYQTDAPFCITHKLDNTDTVVIFAFESSASTHSIKIEKIPLTKEVTPQQYYEGTTDGRPAIILGSGEFSSVENAACDASGAASHAEGATTVSSGIASHAEGAVTMASGNHSHAEGRGTIASGENAHAEGYKATASEHSAHAEGSNTTASGQYSHAEGGQTVASNYQAHAEGRETTASGQASHAQNYKTKATGNLSHAEGHTSEASGYHAHAEGRSTVANHKSQHVFGEYNVADPSAAAATERGSYVEIVGNGTADNARANARTLDWNGNEVLAGKLTVGTAPTNDMDVATKKYVDDNSGGGGGATEVFIATTGTTTFNDIKAAWTSGKICICRDGEEEVFALLSRATNNEAIFVGFYSATYVCVYTVNSSDQWSYSYPNLIQAPTNPAANQFLKYSSGSWAASDLPFIPSLSLAAPEDLGTAAAGSALTAARSDHVHKMPSAADVGAIVAPSSPSSGQILKYNGSSWAAASETTEAFWATYGTTTSADIEAAYQAGKVVLCAYSGRVYVLVSRTSATKHEFSATLGMSAYKLTCEANAWSNESDAYAPYAALPSPATATPQDLGTAARGTASRYAREDHVHKMPSASDVGAIDMPSGGSTGQVLKKTANGVEWANESGGGGGASITEVTISTAGAVTQALDANKLYHFTGALTSLAVTLNTPAAGQIAQYHFDFNCGSTAPTVIIPNTVILPAGTFEASKHYEVDILNNYGTVQSWLLT